MIADFLSNFWGAIAFLVVGAIGSVFVYFRNKLVKQYSELNQLPDVIKELKEHVDSSKKELNEAVTLIHTKLTETTAPIERQLMNFNNYLEVSEDKRKQDRAVVKKIVNVVLRNALKNNIDDEQYMTYVALKGTCSYADMLEDEVAELFRRIEVKYTKEHTENV